MFCLTWAHFIPSTAFIMKLTRWIVDQLSFVEHLGIFSLPEVARLTCWFFSPSRTSDCGQRHCYMLTRGEQWTAWISLSRWSALFLFWLIWRGISRSCWQSFGAVLPPWQFIMGSVALTSNQFVAMTNSSGLIFQCHAWTLTIFLVFTVPATIGQSSFWRSCRKIFLENNVWVSNPCWHVVFVFIPKALNNLRHQAAHRVAFTGLFTQCNIILVAHLASSAGHDNSVEAVEGS